MVIVACFDMLIVREDPARGRKEGTQGSVANSERKNVQGCVSQNSDPMNSILRKARGLGLNASAGHTWNSQDAPGTKSNSGKKRAIWRHCPKRWTSWATSLRTQFWEGTPEETSRQADCTSKVAWTLARKCASSSRRQLRFILLRRRQKHRRSYVWYGFGSFNAQCWARRFELR